MRVRYPSDFRSAAAPPGGGAANRQSGRPGAAAARGTVRLGLAITLLQRDLVLPSERVQSCSTRGGIALSPFLVGTTQRACQPGVGRVRAESVSRTNSKGSAPSASSRDCTVRCCTTVYTAHRNGRGGIRGAVPSPFVIIGALVDFLSLFVVRSGEASRGQHIRPCITYG